MAERRATLVDLISDVEPPICRGRVKRLEGPAVFRRVSFGPQNSLPLMMAVDAGLPDGIGGVEFT